MKYSTKLVQDLRDLADFIEGSVGKEVLVEELLPMRDTIVDVAQAMFDCTTKQLVNHVGVPHAIPCIDNVDWDAFVHNIILDED